MPVPTTLNGTRAKRVLIVDDDEGVRGLVSEMLEAAGMAAVCAPDGEAALAFLRLGLCAPPDAIVLDLAMPNMDGVAFAHRYRATAWRHVPLVVLSGVRGRDEAAERAGATAVVGKPFDVDRLVEVVRMAAEGRWHDLSPLRAEREAERLVAMAEGWQAAAA